jgi:hypothetical protein
MYILQRIAEQKIEDAIARGEFDNLPGKGKPLRLEDDSNVPPELRMAYKILRNSGHVPPEIQEQKEIASIEEMLERCTDEQERYRQIKKLNYMVLRMNIRRKRPLHLEKDQQYYRRAVEKISVTQSVNKSSEGKAEYEG